MLLGTNCCLVYVNPMINECWAINLENYLSVKNITVFIQLCGAQAPKRALSKNCQNGPWEDTGNALRSKSVFSLCKSDDKWMLSDQSRIFPFLLKKNRKIGIGLRGVWGESEMSKTSKNFFLSFLMSFLVNLSKKMKLPFLTQNIGIRSP